MKNLKKILVAIAVVALMISSVVVMVATAENTEYTGELSAAQELLDAVPRDHVYNGRLALAKVYDYIGKNPIDPNTDGYKEFSDELYKVALTILNEYHNKYLEGGEKTDFELLYSLIATYKIPENTPDPDADGTRYTTVTEVKRSVETSSMNYAKVYYDAALAAHINGNISTSTKQLRSLYDHIEQYPVSSLVSAFEQFCSDYNTLSLEITESMVEELNVLADAAEDDDQKEAYKERLGTLLTIIRDHNDDCPVDTTRFENLKTRHDAYIASMVVFEFDQISFLFDDFKAEDFYKKDPDTGKYIYNYPELAEAAALSKVSAALKASSVPETLEGYAELVKKIEEDEKRIADIKEARRQALSDATPLEQFSLTSNVITNDYNDQSQTKYINHYHTSAENKGQYKLYDSADPTQGYWNYYSLGSPNTSGYTEIYVRNKSNSNAIKNGFIMSFDYMVENANPNGGHYSKATFSMRYKKNDTGTVTYADGTNVDFGPVLFTIEYDSATGALKVYNTKQDAIPVATTVYNVAAEGQWFNLMVTYDPVTRYGKLYIDYQEMFDIYYRVGSKGPDELPSNAGVGEFRVSQNPAAWNNMNFDNFMKYEGTEYRELEKFAGMTDEQMFCYYVDFLTGNVASFDNKYFCYTKVKAQADYMKKQYDGLAEDKMTPELIALKESVEKFEAFNGAEYQELLKKIIEAKTAEYASRVETLSKLVIDSSTVDRVNKEIGLLEDFVTENSDLINKTDKRYTDGVATVARMKKRVAESANAVEFAKLFVQFNRATTVASMQKRADALIAIYKEARYDKVENRESVQDDSVIRAFEALINPSGMSTDDPKYITIFDYYTNYMNRIIAERQKIENSDRIVKCIALLYELEGYENSETFWAANLEEVEFFIAVVRNIVSSGNYVASYEGVADAISKYELVDAYLYERIQEDHIAIISAQLEKFKESESYIEKRGICTYVAKYFEENTNINTSLPEIKALQNTLEIYEGELKDFGEAFDEILKRNTQYFIDTVKKMEGLTSYTDLLPIYEEALSYYYIMNVTDSDPVFAKSIEEAIAIFDACDKRLADAKVNSELFVKSVTYIDLLVEDMSLRNKFQLLSDSAAYYEYLDMTYVEMKYGSFDDVADEDVAKKQADYERILREINFYSDMYNTHNAAAESVNGLASEVEQITMALRADGISVVILAIISQLQK